MIIYFLEGIYSIFSYFRRKVSARGICAGAMCRKYERLETEIVFLSLILGGCGAAQNKRVFVKTFSIGCFSKDAIECFIHLLKSTKSCRHCGAVYPLFHQPNQYPNCPTKYDPTQLNFHNHPLLNPTI